VKDRGGTLAGSVWDEVHDTEHAVVIRTYVEHWPRKDRPPEKVLVIVVEPDEETRDRCPQCGQRGRPVEYDVVRWRTLDVHGKRTFLESRLPRIICGRHGKITAAVPWARHDDRFSRPFEEFAAWKAAHMPWTRATAELRITWEALAGITARVAADAAAGLDRLEGLRRIGIDEKSWGKGQDKYLVIVTDHDAGRVAWIGEGRRQATVEAFFRDLGPERAKALTHVSADGADWIHPVVRERAPQAQICLGRVLWRPPGYAGLDVAGPAQHPGSAPGGRHNPGVTGRHVPALLSPLIIWRGVAGAQHSRSVASEVRRSADAVRANAGGGAGRAGVHEVVGDGETAAGRPSVEVAGGGGHEPE